MSCSSHCHFGRILGGRTDGRGFVIPTQSSCDRHQISPLSRQRPLQSLTLTTFAVLFFTIPDSLLHVNHAALLYISCLET
ncbi:unnamed protein product [Dibothriocephalus latus]|uniref:Uncharacterized protein n=1 Tax=Dibothriocephalus latus TaxID=60516 RepID=A0A3P7RQH4_DIBLA|nr:unnamed protein product [Dibothriocephalus latus]